MSFLKKNKNIDASEISKKSGFKKFLKFFWQSELWIALFLIQVSGQPYGIVSGSVWTWWGFGYPLTLWTADGLQLGEVAPSTHFFALVSSFDPVSGMKNDAAIPRTGTFLWEHRSDKNLRNSQIALNFWYQPFPVPFSWAINASDWGWAFQSSRNPIYPEDAHLDQKSITFTFWQAGSQQLVYILLCSLALAYVGFSQTFSRYRFRWEFLFLYTQIMIVSALFGACSIVSSQAFRDTFPIFPWWFFLLESLNQIAVLVFILCLWEWACYCVRFLGKVPMKRKISH